MVKANGVRWKSIALKSERRLTAGLVHHRWPAWSRDGRWLCFAAFGDTDAAWVVTDRWGRLARTLAGPADGGAAFGAGGTLAFGRRGGTAAELWLLAGMDAPPVKLLGGDGRVYREPAWSPDGALLAYAVADGEHGLAHLEVLEVASGTRLVVTSDPHRSDGHPAFSPDGAELFFDSVRDGDAGVWSIRLDGARPAERVTPTGDASRRPAPVSRELLIVEREVDGRGHLVLVDRRTLRERDLTQAGADQREPAVFHTKRGKHKLAYVAPTAKDEGEPSRLDVAIAKLAGLRTDDSPALPDVVEVPAMTGAGAGEDLVSETAAT